MAEPTTRWKIPKAFKGVGSEKKSETIVRRLAPASAVIINEYKYQSSSAVISALPQDFFLTQSQQTVLLPNRPLY